MGYTFSARFAGSRTASCADSTESGWDLKIRRKNLRWIGTAICGVLLAVWVFAMPLLMRFTKNDTPLIAVFGGFFFIGVPLTVIGGWLARRDDIAGFPKWRRTVYLSALVSISVLHVSVIGGWLLAMAGVRSKYDMLGALALYAIVFVSFGLFAHRWSRVALALASFVSFMLWIFPFGLD